jgi:hypothetical protein
LIVASDQPSPAEKGDHVVVDEESKVYKKICYTNIISD